MCAVLMHGLVTSAVATTFVCFAHDPDAFKASHPSLYADLLEAWMARYGSIMVSCGYVSPRLEQPLQHQHQYQPQRLQPQPQPQLQYQYQPQPPPMPPPMAEQQARWGPSESETLEADTVPPSIGSSMGTESAFFDGGNDDGAEL